MRHHTVFEIKESSDVGGLRRKVIEMADASGLSEEAKGRLAIISNEMSTNILKHSQSKGKILFRRFLAKNYSGIEILCTDNGMGIKNIKNALKDGFSTAGSMGTGLGAIKRLSDFFDIYSMDNTGTVMISIAGDIIDRNDKEDEFNIDIYAISVPKSGQVVCGDDLCVRIYQDKIKVLLIDGLGHGEGAAQVSRKAVNLFKNNIHLSIEDIILKLNSGLIGTRGAALAVATIDPVNNIISFAGVGNISSKIITNDTQQSLISHYGIVGGNITKIQKYTYNWPDNSIFIINSDGFVSNISIDKYNGLLNKCASIISGVLYRDFAKESDDSTIMVLKNTKSRSFINADFNSCY